MTAASGTGAGGASDPTGGPTPLTRLRFSWWSVVRALLVLTFGLLAVRVVTLASAPLWWLCTATVIAALLQPAIIWLRRFMPTWAAVLLLLVVLGVFLGLGGYRGLGEINRQVAALRENAVATAEDLQASKTYGSLAQEFGLRAKVDSFFDSLPPVLGGSDTSSAVQAAASGASALFAIFMLTLLMMLFGRRFARGGLAQISNLEVRRRVTALVYRAYQRSAGYVWAMIGRTLSIAVLTYLVASTLGFPAPTALAFWFAGWSLVPAVGLVVAVAPLALGLAVVSPPIAILVGVGGVVAQVVDAVMVQRTIERRTVHLGPALTLVAALIGGSLYGVGGVLIFLAVAVYSVAFLREVGDGADDLPRVLAALGRPSPSAAAPAP